jgi:hypothetical protein
MKLKAVAAAVCYISVEISSICVHCLCVCFIVNLLLCFVVSFLSSLPCSMCGDLLCFVVVSI